MAHTTPHKGIEEAFRRAREAALIVAAMSEGPDRRGPADRFTWAV